MDSSLRRLIDKFQRREVSQGDFINDLPNGLKNNPDLFQEFLQEAINSRDSEELQKALTVLWILDKGNEQLDTLNQLLLEDWHTRYEDIIHDIQRQRNPKSIPFIKKAMQNKYYYLVSYGTGVRQFINQCGHALSSIGTKEAIDIIYELAKSNDPILKDEMLYRISKITGSNNYKRDYSLDDIV